VTDRVEIIGNAEMWLGDCRDVIASWQGIRRFDAVITDPPYGVGLDYGDAVSDSLDDSTNRLIALIDAAESIGDVVLTTVGCYAMELALYQRRPPKWRICWRKGITSRPCAVGFTDWEPVFVYGTGSVHRHAHDLFTAAPEKMGAHGHPCPKSVAWAKWLVSRFTAEGGIVLDPFAGSGTTGVACVEGGRRFVGIEIEPRFFDIACERLQAAQAQERLFA
jgi:site-specific DNA-methyltransferase (adenine-specific)